MRADVGSLGAERFACGEVDLGEEGGAGNGKGREIKKTATAVKTIAVSYVALQSLKSCFGIMYYSNFTTT